MPDADREMLDCLRRRISALEAQLAEAHDAIDILNGAEAEMARQRDAALAQLAEAHADTERLEFISAWCGGDGQLQWVYCANGWIIVQGKEGHTLRDAIDAARAASTDTGASDAGEERKP